MHVNPLTLISLRAPQKICAMRNSLLPYSCNILSIKSLFYVCYLPDTITDTVIAIYYLFSGKNTYYDAVLISYTVTTFLLFSNSCLNPVIYSKIHVNIYNCLKRHIVNCVQKSPCKKIRQTPPPINLANMVQRSYAS